ncbi:MAG: hypothetical protein ACRDD4_06140 [Culicoidibacterales bacterium]
MKWRKKPVIVEAFRLYHEAFPEWIWEASDNGVVELRTKDVVIKTLEGDMLANTGDYIIKGVRGEIYPCKADIFEETYEAVN